MVIGLPEVPEEEVSDGLVSESPAKEESAERTVQVDFKLKHLYQLKEIHQQHVITRQNKHQD